MFFLSECICFLFFIFPLTIICKINKEATPTFRIVGGVEVSSDKYPFIVSLQIGDTHFCGGTLYKLDWVLTAAHCLTYSKRSVKNTYNTYAVVGTALLGSGDGQRIHVKKFYVHPNFERPELNDDIALVKLVKPAKETEFVKLVDISLQPLNITEGTVCAAAGWGKEVPMRRTFKSLKEVELPLLNITYCKDFFAFKVITQRHLCTFVAEGGRDACIGDSGGPLMCNGYQYGITSWGVGCAREMTPALWTRVDRYKDWITKTILNSARFCRNNPCFVTISFIILLIFNLCLC